MYCSPLLRPPPTGLPPGLRDRLGALLAGPRRRADPASRRLCVFALGWIGDFVLAVSALRLLLRAQPAGACTLVVAPAVAGLARAEFPGVECLVLPAYTNSLTRGILPLWWRERPRLGAVRYDRLVCFSHQRPLYYELALSWFDAAQDLRLTTGTYPPAPADGLSTELLGHWRLAERALGRPVARGDILPRLASVAAAEDGRLLVYPFSRDPVRHLPAELLPGILRHWREGSRAPVVFGGSPAERPALERLATAAHLPGLSVETPDGLDGLLAQVAGAGAVLAADSAPAHLAAALDKRCVAMTSRSFWGYAQPWTRSPRQRVFVHGTPAAEVAAALPAL